MKSTDISHDNWTRYAQGLPQGSTALRAKYLLSSGSCVRITPGAPEAGPQGYKKDKQVYLHIEDGADKRAAREIRLVAHLAFSTEGSAARR